MKIRIILGLFLITLVTLTSCTDNNQAVESEVKGRFEGKINGKMVVNPDLGQEHKFVRIQRNKVDGVPETDVFGFRIICEGMGRLIVYLPMHIGTIELFSQSIKHIDDYVLWEAEDGTFYLPRKAPFKVEVKTLSSLDKTIPCIEGTMEGILYSEENPKDSIIISDAFFYFH